MNNTTFDEHFNGSWYNFTDPFNSTIGDADNTNASRHFADNPHLVDIFHAFPMTIIFIVSAVPCGLIIIGSAIFWLKDCTRLRSMTARSSRTRTDNEASLGGTCRPDLLSIVQNGVTDQIMFQNGDEYAMIDTPSSIYPSDMLPNYTDSTRNLYSDAITTPLSNNSVITMIMRNNHLIIETEERVPVNCTVLTNKDLYRSNAPISGVSFINLENDADFRGNDNLLDDDTNSYSEENFSHLCSANLEDARRTFYEPTTSRQADEEDQHVELFHKNILAFACSGEQNETETVPSCSYDYNEEQWPTCELTSRTGFTQSDLTGSSSSTSRHARNDYAYSDQCEYVLSEFPQQRKRSSSLKILTSDEREDILSKSTIFHRIADRSTAPEESVLQVTDCSSSEFSQPSNK